MLSHCPTAVGKQHARQHQAWQQQTWQRPYLPSINSRGRSLRLKPPASSYTQQALTAIRYAQQQAVRQGSLFVAPPHMLLGLLDLSDCTGSQLLTSSGLSAEAAEAALVDEELVPKSSSMAPGDLHWAPDARVALNIAAEAAQEAGQSAAGTPHLILGVVTCSNAAVTAVLEGAGIQPAAFAEQVRAAASSCREAAATQPASGTAAAQTLVQQYQAFVAKHGTAPPAGHGGLGASAGGLVMTPEDDDIYN